GTGLTSGVAGRLTIARRRIIARLGGRCRRRFGGGFRGRLGGVAGRGVVGRGIGARIVVVVAATGRDERGGDEHGAEAPNACRSSGHVSPSGVQVVVVMVQ